MSTINYIKGDATQPQAKGNKIIAHVCNDLGGWGKDSSSPSQSGGRGRRRPTVRGTRTAPRTTSASVRYRSFRSSGISGSPTWWPRGG